MSAVKSKADGGRAGIRTRERVAPLAVFKTAAFVRSATLPQARVAEAAPGPVARLSFSATMVRPHDGRNRQTRGRRTGDAARQAHRRGPVPSARREPSRGHLSG